MNRFLVLALLLGTTFFTPRAYSEEPISEKQKELAQIRGLIKQLTAAPVRSKRPILGVLTYWNSRINTYSDDFSEQLKREELYPLYYDCCRIMEKVYGDKMKTFSKEDIMGFPSQFTIVKLEDLDWGKSHLVVGLWEGNDSTGFYFRHLPGDYTSTEGWKKRDTWNLEGVFIRAKKPAKEKDSGESSSKIKKDPKEITK